MNRRGQSSRVTEDKSPQIPWLVKDPGSHLLLCPQAESCCVVGQTVLPMESSRCSQEAIVEVSFELKTFLGLSANCYVPIQPHS